MTLTDRVFVCQNPTCPYAQFPLEGITNAAQNVLQEALRCLRAHRSSLVQLQWGKALSQFSTRFDEAAIIDLLIRLLERVAC
jgi:hypothetical protein